MTERQCWFTALRQKLVCKQAAFAKLLRLAAAAEVVPPQESDIYRKLVCADSRKYFILPLCRADKWWTRAVCTIHTHTQTQT